METREDVLTVSTVQLLVDLYWLGFLLKFVFIVIIIIMIIIIIIIINTINF